MDSIFVRAEKERLRRETGAVSAALPEDYLRAACARITEKVLALPQYKAARVVMAYVSQPREPDTKAIIRDALEAGKTVLLPRCYAGGTGCAWGTGLVTTTGFWLPAAPKPCACASGGCSGRIFPPARRTCGRAWWSPRASY